MSDNVRPETVAFHELETLVRHLGDELASFRRRALMAEARLKEVDGGGAQSLMDEQRTLAARCVTLEQENAALRSRLDSATTRATQMLDRVRFIRQQAQSGPDAR